MPAVLLAGPVDQEVAEDRQIAPACCMADRNCVPGGGRRWAANRRASGACSGTRGPCADCRLRRGAARPLSATGAASFGTGGRTPAVRSTLRRRAEVDGTVGPRGIVGKVLTYAGLSSPRQTDTMPFGTGQDRCGEGFGKPGELLGLDGFEPRPANPNQTPAGRGRTVGPPRHCANIPA